MSSDTQVRSPVRNPIKPGEGAPKAVAPAAAAPAPAAVGNPGQRLRAVQTPRVSTERFREFGHFAWHQQVDMRPDWDFEDVLNPDFWSGVASFFQANAAAGVSHDRLGTVVEILTRDHAYYGKVYVKGLRKNKQGVADGLIVECIGPSFDIETGKMCPVDLNTGLPWKGRKAAEEK